MKKTSFFVSLFVLLFAGAARAAETYTYSDLVGRLTDMERLARIPEAGETSGEATSRDRASKYDAVSDKYIAWDANGDGQGAVEKFADESILMADLQGPGMINHIWSAAPGKGKIKIYIDGAEAPVVDLPFEDFFNGTTAPFNRKNLCYRTAANGMNSWVPIPFQKSCRIVGEKGWGNYYYFQWVKFSGGTSVPTFSMNLDAAANVALDKVDAVLGNCAPEVLPDNDFVLPAGGTVEFIFEKPAAFTEIQAKLDLPKDDAVSRDMMRGITISIYWDGASEPAVWAPIGDFFGVTCLQKSCPGYPTGLTEDSLLYNRWYMPFKSAKIVIQNDNPEPVTFQSFATKREDLKADITLYSRFHAKWHRNAFLPDVKADPQRWLDWTLLKTEGRGKYVGVSLHIENFRGSWWGEGDEKFFIDGEKIPSFFGTGSEDYFGYAWSSANRFVQAFHSQPTNVNNTSYIVNNRWHVSDAVPFQKSFAGYIEKYYQDERPCLYAATAFWYLDAEGTDPYKALPLSERTGFYIDTTTHHQMPPGGIGGRELSPEQRPANLGGQNMSSHGWDWERDKQLWWRPKNPGETVTLRLPAPADGKYKLSVRRTTARDYGIHQFSVNGTRVGAPLDFYSAEVTAQPPVELGTVDLKKGDNDLTLTVIGKNEKSSGYFAGIDYVVLVPAE